MKRRREPFYEELGRRIAGLRQQRKLSQQALGALLQPQMTRASIANIETGQQRVLAHSLVQLATALGCDLESLAGAREEEHPEAGVVQHELELKLVRDEHVPKAVVDALTRSLGLTTKRRSR